eukprot:CAMPEP_0203682878 /NCGR_PEP_ID=MMETSP0090-20130426/47230_1 /ASSEMBLY_ACC=CAM_ASM_001088 /TAXON_ID=426623 /ORGANISM="Chaetoceros affinis, Strain CCMP159" /LENGTH=222 /DNA_ID=CAMNT_0050551995 /DNA_START=1085 /DNA_END=1751 /DNA_ORIENTATION=-
MEYWKEAKELVPLVRRGGRRGGDDEIAQRCDRKSLYKDCPLSCDTCPSPLPSVLPSADPSPTPSVVPSPLPSVLPSADPSPTPSVVPTAVLSAPPSSALTLVPSTAPTSFVCSDRNDEWTIGKKTKPWCQWVHKFDNVLERCANQDLSTDCPVSCGSCTDPPIGPMQQIALGGWFTCAVDTNNDGFCWGDNRYGRLPIVFKTYNDVPIPTKIQFDSSILKMV